MLEWEIWGLVLLVAGGFAATNLDNLVLLVVLMGADPGKRAAIALGFLTSAISILLIAALGSVLGSKLDPGIIGYLGLIPLSLGCYLLYRKLRGHQASGPRLPGAGKGSGWLISYTLMLSNSGDSLAIFLPLLTESDRGSLLWEVSIFLVAAVLWVALAWQIADQPRLARRIETVGEVILPWIMIIVGVYILMDTGTDTLIR